ncbi:hypothetical protein [Aurantiacibacter aquimixticola]|uniref:Uncharacterized protein n=1 Tax=Aurantiacibacter aquimixticola TaxID=1958945 RepID=A0A419RVL7_9SPHN|nr:hypothetical protein [Aurantiacibacter aquimixticola]RJY09813.1 hypothetical protein D6201_11010 [Aurantiacibacter aquimixticola]
MLGNHAVGKLCVSAVCGLAAIYLVTPACPALAQEEGVWPTNQEAHPGQIVYSRDVPRGTATRRIAQGEAHTVAPDQSATIEAALALGLQPLTDVEQAGVTASLSRSLATAETAIATGLSVISGPTANADFTRSESGGTSAGGIVAGALSVLPGALSVLSRVGGPE